MPPGSTTVIGTQSGDDTGDNGLDFMAITLKMAKLQGSQI